MRPFASAIVAASLLALLAPAHAGSATPHWMPLAKGWRVKPAAAAAGLGQQFFRTDFDDAAWEATEIKEEEDPYNARYIFYRTWVELPGAWAGKTISIVFGGVDDDAVVYVNGKKMGDHKGWNEEFTFDITAVARCGERNLVAVVADNSGGGGAGIWRPVSLALTEEIAKMKTAQEAASRAEFAKIPHRIVYETWHESNWELFTVGTDGSPPVNLTRTPDAHELYPHVSPDGARVCFVVDEGEGDKKVRNVYYMNLDGTGRTRVGTNIRQPCWSPDGSAIAYLGGEYEKFAYLDFATRGIGIYDLKTRTHRPHPNKSIHHLYNLCWTPDGRWFVATVHAGMGFKHAILAIEADGMKVHNLHIPGCRPDMSPDGRTIAWGASDWALRAGELDLSAPEPRVTNIRTLVSSTKPLKIYHLDWSPDGKHIAFSRGPSKKRMGHVPEIVGIRADGWNICVADATAKDRWIALTTDGHSNKEPDWAPAGSKNP